MDVTTAHLLHQYRVQISDLEDENKRLREGIAAIKKVAVQPRKDHWCIRMCEELLKEGQ